MADEQLIQNEVILTKKADAESWLRKAIEGQRWVQGGVNWSRKYSLFGYPFVTACCGMEYMSLNSPRYDLARGLADYFISFSLPGKKIGNQRSEPWRLAN